MAENKVYLVYYERIPSEIVFLEAITSNYPSKRVSNNCLLISTSDEPIEIHKKVDFPALGNDSHVLIITRMVSYYVWMSSDILEWIKGKDPTINVREASPDGPIK